MKKIFRKFTLLLLLVPMLNSCELDPIDYSDINPSIFPQSKEDLEQWFFRVTILCVVAGGTVSIRLPKGGKCL